MVKKEGGKKKKSLKCPAGSRRSKSKKTCRRIIPKIKRNKNMMTKSPKDEKIEKVLVENFVSLQKVMTHMSIKFDDLSNQISKLLDLFEISAKSLSKGEFNLERENKDNKKIIEKIDGLSDQNKIIARGLTLLHETPKQEREYTPKPEIQNPIQKQNMQAPLQVPRPIKEQSKNAQYQKSISLGNLSDN